MTANHFQFIMVKPKAVGLGLAESFFKEFEMEGLTLIWQKRILLDAKQVDFLYHPYIQRPWFQEFVEVMTGGDSVLSLWVGGENIIELTSSITESIRQRYKDLVEFYDLHSADSEEIAIEQLRFLAENKIDIIINNFLGNGI